ncbi:GNAT family N-acetyltransferase [Maricaulis sp. CAU 1757]
MQIRAADEDDHDGIDRLLKAAFPGPTEARLVTSLRAADADTLELVADSDGQIVGEVMISPVSAVSAFITIRHGLGLGPLAVLPDYRGRGIGSALVEAALDYLRPLGAPWCVLVGEPDFYARFGFEPASAHEWSWSADPDGKAGDAFQVVRLQAAADLTGPAQVHYHPAFEVAEDEAAGH